MENRTKPFHDNRTDTYFLDYYVPKRKWELYSESKLVFSMELLKYKDNIDDKIWANYTIDLMNALAFIAKERMKSVSEIRMVSVPCSKPWKQPTMRKTINKIAELSKDGTVELFTRCIIPFVDDSDLIIRTDPIETAHTSESRPSFEDQRKTMALNGKVITRDVGYVIMDDILTSGTQMRACYSLIRQTGIRGANIQQLVIGRTIQ